MLPGPPTVYQSILDHPRLGEFDMSSLRLAVTGAAPVPVELIRRMRAELGFETIVTGYGLTEATGIATMCRHDDDPETISTTSGSRASPTSRCAIVDDDGSGGAARRAGRGRDPRLQRHARATSTTRRRPRRPSTRDGWLHTGDVAVMNERGYIRITDRTKDMFIVGGFNAYPAEIENMINDHPAVGQVAVVGVPDERMGEVGYAYVIPRLNATITPDELRTWCREKMANYKVPRYFEIVDALPAQRERQGAEVRAPRPRPRRGSDSRMAATRTALRVGGELRPHARVSRRRVGRSVARRDAPVRDADPRGRAGRACRGRRSSTSAPTTGARSTASIPTRSPRTTTPRVAALLARSRHRAQPAEGRVRRCSNAKAFLATAQRVRLVRRLPLGVGRRQADRQPARARRPTSRPAPSSRTASART